MLTSFWLFLFLVRNLCLFFIFIFSFLQYIQTVIYPIPFRIYIHTYTYIYAYVSGFSYSQYPGFVRFLFLQPHLRICDRAPPHINILFFSFTLHSFSQGVFYTSPTYSMYQNFVVCSSDQRCHDGVSPHPFLLHKFLSDSPFHSLPPPTQHLGFVDSPFRQ